jgi:hypothetical protein
MMTRIERDRRALHDAQTFLDQMIDAIATARAKAPPRPRKQKAIKPSANSAKR